MKETILVIDDEQEIVSFIADRLVLEGYEVKSAYTAEEALMVLDESVHLIILDIMLPHMSGFELCEEIRDRVACPIIFLSAMNTEESRIEGLMIGGDDYINKPFSVNELLARVDAHLRREARTKSKRVHPVVRFGKLRIDMQGATVKVNQQRIPLTKKEFQIIKLFALHPGRIMSKDYILEKVWGFDTESDESTVVEHMKKIRAKLAEFDEENKYIQTVWGLGYKWERL